MSKNHTNHSLVQVHVEGFKVVPDQVDLKVDRISTYLQTLDILLPLNLLSLTRVPKSNK